MTKQSTVKQQQQQQQQQTTTRRQQQKYFGRVVYQLATRLDERQKCLANPNPIELAAVS